MKFFTPPSFIRNRQKANKLKVKCLFCKKSRKLAEKEESIKYFPIFANRDLLKEP